LAQDRSSLADLQKDQETKKSMLQEAVQGKERAVELLIKELNYMEMKIPTPSALYATVGNTQIQHGSLLARLYVLTRDAELLRKAIAAFEDAARWLERLNQRSRMAEAYWKVARTYDDLGEYLQASQNFDFASDNYGKAMHNIPQLKDFYRDHSLYMKAWSEIERARYHHARQEFVSAKERFEKAADLHKTLKQWSYLAPNYSAWATVESAEDLSRREQSEESLGAFEQAAKLFCETKRSLQAQLDKIDNEDEKQMASNMIEATDMRQEYCNSRIAIEEARILDKKGDHDSSSEKYGLAAKTLEKIVQRLESQQERREFEFILNISRAWQKMTRAEAEASPELFVEASRLFEEAKEFAPNEKAIMLALGHSRFCRALDAGTRFADTRDRTLHVAAEKYLESAANYYVKAGYQSASEYAKATELLFDAYVRMDSAKEESDPEKKAKFYAMAEKVLQTSAGYFMKAEHPEKRKQVLGLLEKVKEERELATSLTEMLHSPSIISTTTAFATPTPTHEEAVGSDRFEHADVQANVITRQKELKVDERLDVEIELVNAGKSPALLIKVAEVVPQDFELIEKPGNYRVEDSYLNMKGKRLDALKTEELKIVLKPKAQGVFQLKPKILYIDENGKYKSHEPEPISITVKELGIKGWLKGAR
jgi:tetratricopeptide (TPR) repeat protein